MSYFVLPLVHAIRPGFSPYSLLKAIGLALCAAAQLLAVDPLATQVTIYRDAYGVPHIAGESEQAAFFGYGYAQAQDHLERMMLQYRDAQGRLSEVKGMAALGDGEPRFDNHEYRYGGDYLQRLLRTWQTVADNKQRMDPNVYQLLDGFARGVNAYIAGHRTSIPAWIDRVTAEDVEALERSNYTRFYSSGDGLQKLTAKKDLFSFFGSNQWAVSAAKSANGRILHGSTVHMPWSTHMQLYEAHLIVPGKLNAGGIGWFGSPFFLSGFNDKISWSVTWNQPNIADVYEEKFRGLNPPQYLFEGTWRDMRVEQATFHVADGNVSKVVTRKLLYTHHGPVVRINGESGRAYSLKVPNFDGVNYSKGLYTIMKSRDLASFQAALAQQLVLRWNFLYTDSSNLYWVHNAVVAQRDSRFDTLKPLPGWIKETEWGPYLPFSANPQLINPASGFLQNCNNPPWTVTRGSGLKPLDPVPYYLAKRADAADGEEVLNSRGERLFGVLTRPQAKFTLDDFEELGFDTYILAADVFVPVLLEAAARRQPIADAHVAHAIDLVRQWDRRSSAGSAAYTYIHHFAEAYRRMFSARLFDRFSSYNRSSIAIHSRIEQYLAWWAFERGVKRVEQLYGKANVPWGEVNGVVRGDWLPLSGTGDFDVLHPDVGDERRDGRMYCKDGWGSIIIVMEGQPKEIWTLLPYGESEDPQSPHYADQARLHSAQHLKRFWITPEDILAHTESVWGQRGRLTKSWLGTHEISEPGRNLRARSPLAP